jgi:cytochrome c biogenesis protein CcdA
MRVLALRVAVTAALCGGAFAAAGWTPAAIGVAAGALTWLAATGRHDLPPRGASRS